MQGAYLGGQGLLLPCASSSGMSPGWWTQYLPGVEGPDSPSCRNPRSLLLTLKDFSLGFEVGTALIHMS